VSHTAAGPDHPARMNPAAPADADHLT